MSDAYAPARLLVRDSSKLDLPVPEPVAAAYERHGALVTVRDDLTHQQAQAHDDLTAALSEAGTDTARLAAALTGSTAVKLSTLGTPEVREALAAAIVQAEAALRRAWVHNGDAVILGWRPAVEEAGAALRAAALALPDVDDLDDYEAVTRSGGAAAQHWAAAVAATTFLREVGQLLNGLNGLGYDLVPTPNGLVPVEVLRVCRLSWQHVEERTAGSAWDAVRSGAQVTLLTSDELREAMAQLRAQGENNLTPSQRYERIEATTRTPSSWPMAG